MSDNLQSRDNFLSLHSGSTNVNTQRPRDRQSGRDEDFKAKIGTSEVYKTSGTSQVPI